MKYYELINAGTVIGVCAGDSLLEAIKADKITEVGLLTRKQFSSFAVEDDGWEKPISETRYAVEIKESVKFTELNPKPQPEIRFARKTL